MQLERRYANFNSENGVLIGYPIVFDSESRNLGGFVEIVKRGAVHSAEGMDVKALYNHDFANVLGRTGNGSLKLVEDERGMKMELSLPDTTLGNDIRKMVDAGLLTAMSFGFTVNKDKMTKRAGGVPLRILEDITVYEVSIVAEPAYPETSVALRSLEQLGESEKYEAELTKRLFELALKQNSTI